MELENNNSELNVENEGEASEEKGKFVPRASKEIERKGLEKIQQELSELREKNKSLETALGDINSLKLDNELTLLGVKSEEAKQFLKDYSLKTGIPLKNVMEDSTINFHVRKLEGNITIDSKRPDQAPSGTDSENIEWYIKNNQIPADSELRDKVFARLENGQ